MVHIVRSACVEAAVPASVTSAGAENMTQGIQILCSSQAKIVFL